MPRKRIGEAKSDEVRFHNPERQAEALRLLEQAKRREQEYILKPVRIDSKTVLLKKVRRR